MLILGVIFALIGVIAGLSVLIHHSGRVFWFYWIAPFLMMGVGGVLISLTVGYYLKVGRLEMKGRPRSD